MNNGRSQEIDRHTASALSIKQIRAMVDELIAAHGPAMPAGIRAASKAA